MEASRPVSAGTLQSEMGSLTWLCCVVGCVDNLASVSVWQWDVKAHCSAEQSVVCLALSTPHGTSHPHIPD